METPEQDAREPDFPVLLTREQILEMESYCAQRYRELHALWRECMAGERLEVLDRATFYGDLQSRFAEARRAHQSQWLQQDIHPLIRQQIEELSSHDPQQPPQKEL